MCARVCACVCERVCDAHAVCTGVCPLGVRAEAREGCPVSCSIIGHPIPLRQGFCSLVGARSSDPPIPASRGLGLQLLIMKPGCIFASCMKCSKNSFK